MVPLVVQTFLSENCVLHCKLCLHFTDRNVCATDDLLFYKFYFKVAVPVFARENKCSALGNECNAI